MDQDERKKLKDTIDRLTRQLDKVGAPAKVLRNETVNKCIDIVVEQLGLKPTELINKLKALKKTEL